MAGRDQEVSSGEKNRTCSRIAARNTIRQESKGKVVVSEAFAENVVYSRAFRWRN